MQVMFNVTNPLQREQTMTTGEDRSKVVAIKELLEREEDFVRSAVQSSWQVALEAEMTEALAAGKGERTDEWLGYRSGYYSRALITRVGTLELRVPQDRAGRFDGAVRALSALGEGFGGHVGGDVCAGGLDEESEGGHRSSLGHSFSASSISAINKTLDESLKAFSERRLRLSPLPHSQRPLRTRPGRRGYRQPSCVRGCRRGLPTGEAARSSLSSLPTARAGQVGATSCLA